MLKIDQSSKDALESYLHELHGEYYSWYEKHKERNGKWWQFLNFVIIGASVLTTVLATLQTSELDFVKNNLTLIQIALIAIPIIGTAASAVLLQTKALELYSLREAGRESLQFLIDEGRRRFAACKDEKEYAEVHEYLVQEVRKVEQSQAEGFFSTNGQNA